MIMMRASMITTRTHTEVLYGTKQGLLEAGNLNNDTSINKVLYIYWKCNEHNSGRHSWNLSQNLKKKKKTQIQCKFHGNLLNTFMILVRHFFNDAWHSLEFDFVILYFS